jgi:two-component system chemotaxis response regulator CheY
MGLNVLVVDDSSTMRAMVARVLQISGLPVTQVFEAGNGREALDLVGREWIDLVLADINMPVMNGLEMIEHLREMEPTAHLPVVVVSTESSQARIDQVQRQGVRFVHKPFTPETIRKVVGELVEDLSDATR